MAIGYIPYVIHDSIFRSGIILTFLTQLIINSKSYCLDNAPVLVWHYGTSKALVKRPVGMYTPNEPDIISSSF